MPHYHLFYLSCEDARSIESAVFQAPDDEAAVALIQEGEFPLPLELWSGYDRIRRFEHAPRADAISDNRRS
jgi:hypothetical protein